MQVNVIEKPKPCKNWETWYEAITLAFMMLTYQPEPGGGVVSFETRLIDSENAEEVAQKLGVPGKTLSEVISSLRKLGAVIEQQQPPGTGIRAKFSKKDFLPCR